MCECHWLEHHKDSCDEAAHITCALYQRRMSQWRCGSSTNHLYHELVRGTGNAGVGACCTRLRKLACCHAKGISYSLCCCTPLFKYYPSRRQGTVAPAHITCTTSSYVFSPIPRALNQYLRSMMRKRKHLNENDSCASARLVRMVVNV